MILRRSSGTEVYITSYSGLDDSFVRLPALTHRAHGTVNPAKEGSDRIKAEQLGKFMSGDIY